MLRDVALTELAQSLDDQRPGRPSVDRGGLEVPEHPGVQLDFLRPSDLDARGGCSSATRESSKIQNPAEATPVLSVIIGMIARETVGTDIASSSRPVARPVPQRCRTRSAKPVPPERRQTACRLDR